MRRRLIFALVPALAIASAALAQPAPPPGGHEVRMRHGGPPSEEMKAHHEAMRRQHLEDLKIVLRLRPDQEAALNAFTAAHEPKRFEMKLDSKGQTTPQRLEQMAKREEALRAARQKHRDALAKFYAALSPDQQKVFDALQRLKGGRHGGPGHGPGRMMMHGGPGGHDVMIRREIRRGGPGPHDD
jgi:periplasmic protein CpxP/Spy